MIIIQTRQSLTHTFNLSEFSSPSPSTWRRHELRAVINPVDNEIYVTGSARLSCGCQQSRILDPDR